MARTEVIKTAPVPATNVNLPNLLTVSRILLIPVFVVLFSTATPEGSLWAALVFVVAFFFTIGIWQTRNHLVFGVYQLSPKGSVISFTAGRVLWMSQPQRTLSEVCAEFYAHVYDVFSRRYGIPNQNWRDREIRLR